MSHTNRYSVDIHVLKHQSRLVKNIHESIIIIRPFYKYSWEQV